MMKFLYRSGQYTANKRLLLQQGNRDYNYKKRFGSSCCILSTSVISAFVLSKSDVPSCNSEALDVKVDDQVVLKDKYLFDKFLDELRGVLPEDQIELDEDECRLRGKPWSSYHTVTGCPRVIVSPSSTEEVCTD